MMVRQAVFLVGGKGTRLGALTRATPKPLLEVAPGLRFLDFAIEEVARYGFTDVLLVAGHLGDQVEDAYQGRTIRGAQVRVIREAEPQGTGGAVRMVAGELDPWFLLLNGDSLFEFNLRALVQDPADDFVARLALRTVPDPARFGAVEVDGEVVVGFREKDPDLKGPALINGGVYLVNRSILELIEGPCSIEQDVFPKLISAGQLRGRKFDGYFLDIGLPDTYDQAKQEIPARRKRPCAFLDRDGVLNVDAGYTHRPEDLLFVPGAPEAVRRLNEAGYYVIVITNQAGVAKGHFEEAAVHGFHTAMADALAATGAHIDAFYHCPFHEAATVEAYRQADHPDRKPNPGMILKAMAEWPVDSGRSFLIGDMDTDIAAARAAGLPGVLFPGGDLSVFLESLPYLINRGNIGSPSG